MGEEMAIISSQQCPVDPLSAVVGLSMKIKKLRGWGLMPGKECCWE